MRRIGLSFLLVAAAELIATGTDRLSSSCAATIVGMTSSFLPIWLLERFNCWSSDAIETRLMGLESPVSLFLLLDVDKCAGSMSSLFLDDFTGRQ